MPACNAPCIINTQPGFHLVYCGRHAGHADEKHALLIRSQLEDAEATVVWQYVADSDPALTERFWLPEARCQEHIFVPALPSVLPAPLNLKSRFQQELLRPATQIGPSTYFHCGLPHAHEKCHIREGVFRPLRIKWRISW